MPKDWFAAFAPDETGEHQNTGQPRATGATTAGNPQKPRDFEVAQNDVRVGNHGATTGQPPAGTDTEPSPVALVAHGRPKAGNHGATAETKETRDFQEPVALVAPAALQIDKVGTAPGWDAADWRTYYDERAGIAEFDGGLPRAEAEGRAYECCVAHWMNRHAPRPTEPESGCVHCREPMPESDALPFLTRGGHVWLHSYCHAPWIARLRAEAVTALAGLELTSATALGATESRR